jgi:hypothetical protein
MSISVDTRKYLALEKKRDKLQSRASATTVEMAELRAMYDAVGAGALKLLDDAIAAAHDKQAIREAENS